MIEYSSGHIEVTDEFVKKMFDAGLYVDSDGKLFKRYWLEREKYFPEDIAAVFSLAEINGEPIGVAVSRLHVDVKIYDLEEFGSHTALGSIGVFVKPEFRKQGVGTQLLKNAIAQVDQLTKDLDPEILKSLACSGWVRDRIEDPEQFVSYTSIYQLDAILNKREQEKVTS